VYSALEIFEGSKSRDCKNKPRWSPYVEELMVMGEEDGSGGRRRGM
jgi:hypothetical protein